MNKKIIFILIFCCMIFSCGKKGDPVYKNSKNETKQQSILINRV